MREVIVPARQCGKTLTRALEREALDRAATQFGMTRRRRKLYPLALPATSEPTPARSVALAWYVVCTEGRSGRKAIKSLNDAGYQVYSPVMKRDVRRRRAIVEREYPLFYGYLFVRLPKENADWRSIVALDGVDSVLGDDEKPIPIPDSEVFRFQKAEENMEFDETRRAQIRRGEIGRTQRETLRLKYKPGMRIKASKGPFSGFHGYVVNVTGRGAVKAMIDIFDRLTPVEFTADMIKPDGGP